MRTNFSVLVTGEQWSYSVTALRSLGLTTAFVPYDRLIGTLRRGASYDFAADAILVDGASGNPLRSDGTSAAWNVVNAISALSDMYVMPSGVRWNAVPILLIGEHACPEWPLWQKPGKSAIDYMTPYDTIELGRGRSFWLRVYEHLEELHLAFWPVLADSMQSLGMIFRELHGRLHRAGVRPGIRREDLESALYAGSCDRFFDARSEAMRRILSTLGGAPDATAQVLHELDRIAFDPRAREAAPELLTHLHPYLFDIAQHEAIAQRSLTLRDHSTVRFDMLRRETLVMGRPCAEIIEFKRGGHRQLNGRGLSQSEYIGAEQVTDYHDLLCEHDDLARRRLGSSFLDARKRVVGGYVGNADRTRLERARSRFRGIEIEGWDEVAVRNRARFGIPDDWEPERGIAS